MLKEISIEIIRKCPNNCVHCSSVSNMECTEIISFDKFVEIIDGAIKLGLETICLSGGEPFLHPEIVNMIAYVNSKKLDCYVYTSGIIFNENMEPISLSEHVLNEISGKVTKLIFNVEASNPSTYDRIMGTKNCFEFLKQSILRANAVSIVTEAHFVPMKLNVDDEEATISLCEELGISKISFLRLVLHGRAVNNEQLISLSSAETDDLKKRLNNIKLASNLNVRVGVPLSESDSKHDCEAAKGKLNIKYDGFVYPCEVFKNDRVKMDICGVSPENIYDKNIKDIYNDSVYLNIVRNHIKDFTCSRTCENCVGQYFISSQLKEDAKDGE